MSHRNLIDLTGHVYFRLTVLSQAPNKGERSAWYCQCICGNIAIVTGNGLRTGDTKSCGCWNNEQHTTHGKHTTPEYGVFYGMFDRCNNPRHSSFHNYGGRGITLEWKTFEQFFADMGPRPTSKHTIERVNNNGPYSKANCKWATWQEQANNKRQRQSHYSFTYQGERLSVAQWAKWLGVPYTRLLKRFKAEWSPKRIVTTPCRQYITASPHS